jgi:cyanophycinase
MELLRRHLRLNKYRATARVVVAFCALVGSSASAQSDDVENPFGLPSAVHASKPGAVMLHGGGKGLADDVRQEFVRLAGGKHAHIVLLPSEMCQIGKDENGEPLTPTESAAEYEKRLAAPRQYGRWAKLESDRQVVDFHFLYRDSHDAKSNERFYTLLENATGVWLPAYDQEWLPREFAAEYPRTTSRFQLALRQVVARGGVVGGLGGGMNSLGETIIASDAIGERGWIKAKVGFGLALFGGAVVDQNFEARAGRLERMTDLLRNGARLNRLANTPGVERRTIGLGVERQTAMVLQGNTVRVLGEGRGHVFLKSNGDRTITWRTLGPGEAPVAIQTSADSKQAPQAIAYSSPRSMNPFGMPEPLDATHPGSVVLHGGGNTDEIIDLFPRLMLSAKPCLIHCPAARESCRPSVECNGAKLAARLEEVFSPWRDLQKSGRISELVFVTTSSGADANRPEFVKPLAGADALWFCGGDQKPLASLLVDRQEPTLFQREAAKIVSRGGIVGGTSAGLAIMPEIMIEGGEAVDGRPEQATLSRGLGLMTNVLAEQHFDARTGRIERLTGLLRDHKRLGNFMTTSQPGRLIGLAVEEDTALIAQGKRVRVVGRNLAHVFLQSKDPREITWHALKSGDAAVITQRNDEHVLELEEWSFGDSR